MAFHPQRIPPGPGQESVWDYPRPPKLEPSTKRIRIVFNSVTIVDTQKAMRMLETSHPPVYYIPPDDAQMQYFSPTPRSTFCEWKGVASYYTLAVEDKQCVNGAWYYPSPTARFADMKDYIAVYPSQMDACYVDDEVVQSQAGDFYGGWITKDIVGPFKGGAGSWGW